MSNVIDFPTDKVRKAENNKLNKYQQQMTNLARMLDARYEHLQDLANVMNKIAKECDKYEKQYETILKEYSKRIGPQNVEIKFYDYSSEIGISFDPCENTFTMADYDRTDDLEEYMRDDSE